MPAVFKAHLVLTLVTGKSGYQIPKICGFSAFLIILDPLRNKCQYQHEVTIFWTASRKQTFLFVIFAVSQRR